MVGRIADGLGRLRDALAIEDTPEGLRIVVTRRIDAPPERVWELLVDTRRWPDWGPSVLDVETRSPRIEAGASGRVRTFFGRWLPFTVTRVSEWSWAWRIGPVQATGHRVVPQGDVCRAGFEVPLFAFPYVLVCWWALARIEVLATASSADNRPGRSDATDRSTDQADGPKGR
ncbi:SRPBCC family protein [Halanaeroarchaeum sp. HSR-CO]|uniref:SRPBCC family protein n=1 Tax=Halanaeroarchaeum sp. HSR-CO TaxID=2866382 RepID=UPI00217EC769|nr:SRPBCC family protein [Halanaeroarchaeum sp. HSR-CO]UWG47342.1 SRPBCC family protein [Halanaeroarchaeum sp. HSR-CO]